jgi:hypothetical protein
MMHGCLGDSGEIELLLGKEYPLKWELQNEVLL